MYFEEDKDLIIGNDGEVHLDDDDLITWDEVLDDTKAQKDDDIVSIKDTKKGGSKDDAIVDLGDDLELVQDEDEDLDDEQLRQILKGDSNKNASSRQKAFDAFGENQAQEEDDAIPDLDLDNPLDEIENNIKEDNQEDFNQEIPQDDDNNIPNEEERPISRKEEIGIKNAKSGVSPLLVAILFFVVIVGGVYYYLTFFKDNDDVEELKQPSVQETLNNTTQQDIENRQKDEIDVVNEENLDEVKPDEKEQEDKKEVLTIIPTGRVNPFVPIGKYVKAPEKIVAYDKVNIPKPPKEFGQNTEQIDKLLSIAVSGIMYDPQKPSAIITFEDNDYFVQKGDRLDDYRVIDITKNAVLISLGKDIYRASVGEEFKITSNFEGNAQYLNNHGRYYHSVNSESDSNTSKRGYVSPLDVEVKAKN